MTTLMLNSHTVVLLSNGFKTDEKQKCFTADENEKQKLTDATAESYSYRETSG